MSANECCSHRNMLWNVAEPTRVDRECVNLHGVCQACHSRRTTSLYEGSGVDVTDVRSIATDVRGDGKVAGTCLEKTTALTGELQSRGVPATVRTAPFGFDERLHYVTLINGGFVSELDDCLYAVDPTLTQFEGEPSCSGSPVEDVPDVVIVPKESEVATRWYASLEPPTSD